MQRCNSAAGVADSPTSSAGIRRTTGSPRALDYRRETEREGCERERVEMPGGCETHYGKAPDAHGCESDTGHERGS
jgi:hypothetical protein